MLKVGVIKVLEPSSYITETFKKEFSELLDTLFKQRGSINAKYRKCNVTAIQPHFPYPSLE